MKNEKIESLYLAHPLLFRHFMRSWELGFEYRTGIELINPFYDVYREEVEALDKGERDKYDLNHIEIVERDLDLILKSGGLVGIINGDKSYGTIQELVYATLYNKKRFLVITTGDEEHPWLKYHSDEIFTNLQDFEDTIVAYNALYKKRR